MTVRQFCWDYLAYDCEVAPTVTDWLTISQQLLLGLTAGRVFVDEVGELTAVRNTFSYFPHDLWLYMLAAQWGRIAEEQAFVGRTAGVGDEVGSRLLAGRLVHDLMQLCFLMERQYVPYPKWFGSGFKRLACAETMEPLLTAVLQADDFPSREDALCAAYEQAAHMHNQLGVAEPVSIGARWFHDRPFRISAADDCGAALRATIKDETVRAIDTHLGSIDQFSHSTVLRSYPRLRPSLHGLYK